MSGGFRMTDMRENRLYKKWKCHLHQVKGACGRAHFVKVTDFKKQIFLAEVAISECLIHTAYDHWLAAGTLHLVKGACGYSCHHGEVHQYDMNPHEDIFIFCTFCSLSCLSFQPPQTLIRFANCPLTSSTLSLTALKSCSWRLVMSMRWSTLKLPIKITGSKKTWRTW